MAISTEMPNEPRRATSASMSSRPSGSSPAVGSSSSTSSRIADDRLRELRALAHAGREPADRPEARFVEADEIEDVGRALARRARGQPAQLTERRHHVGRGLVEREAVVLGHVAEPGANTDRDRCATSMPQTSMRPFGRVGEAEQQPEHRRLAGAVRADETDAPAGHLDRQIVERECARIALREAIDTKEGTSCHGFASLSGASAKPLCALWWRRSGLL